MIISRSELAELLGVPPSKVSILATQGIFKPISKGKYEVKQCVNAYIEYNVEQAIKKASRLKNSDSSETLEFWKMTRQKSAALKEMGVLMSTIEAEKIMSGRLSQIRNVLNTIDSTWAPYVIGVKTVEDAQKILGAQLDKVFEQLSSLEDITEEEEEVPLETEEDEVSEDVDEADVMLDDEYIEDEEVDDAV